LNKKFPDFLRTNPLLRDIRFRIEKFSEINESPHKSLVKKLERYPDLAIFDVGANLGQFGIDMRRNGFSGKIFSFEPILQTYLNLVKTTQKYRDWKPFQLGMGSSDGVQSINVSGNAGLSSSILPMLEIHKRNFPKSVTNSRELIRMSTVDHQLQLLKIEASNILLKIDVQGYESEVLKGANTSLRVIPACFLEVSLQPLYEGELTILPILNMLADSGHHIVDVFRGVKSKKGELLQLDIVTELSDK